MSPVLKCNTSVTETESASYCLLPLPYSILLCGDFSIFTVSFFILPILPILIYQFSSKGVGYLTLIVINLIDFDYVTSSVTYQDPERKTGRWQCPLPASFSVLKLFRLLSYHL